MSVYAFFPILAAILYGVSYALMQKLLAEISSTTFFIYISVVSVLFGLIIYITKIDTITFMPKEMGASNFFYLVLASIFSAFGFLFTIFATKHISASYAAIGEISYVLFVPLFLFLLFGIKSLNPTMALGGALIFVGCIILVWGQTKTT